MHLHGELGLLPLKLVRYREKSRAKLSSLLQAIGPYKTKAQGSDRKEAYLIPFLIPKPLAS